MHREIMGKQLDNLIPGDSTEIDEAILGMLFPPDGSDSADGAIPRGTMDEESSYVCLDLPTARPR